MPSFAATALATSGQFSVGQTTAPATTTPYSTYQLPMTRDAHFSDLGKRVNVEFDELMLIMIDRSILNAEHRNELIPTVKMKPIRLRKDLRELTADNGNSPFMLKVLKGNEEQAMTRLARFGDGERRPVFRRTRASAEQD